MVRPDGRFLSGMRSGEVNAHYKNGTPAKALVRALKTQVLQIVT